MIRILGICVKSGPSALTGRDVGLLRMILAGSNTKRGLPGSKRFNAWWSQIHNSVKEGHEVFYSEIIDRLSKHDSCQGLNPETIKA